MKFNFKILVKEAGIYGIGRCIIVLIPIFTLSIYTRIFTPEEWGVIELILTLCILMGVLGRLGSNSAVTYFFHTRQEEIGQGAVFTTALALKVAVGAVLIVIAVAVGMLVNQPVFEGRGSVSVFLLAFAGAVLRQLKEQVALGYRLTFRPLGYLRVMFGQAIAAATIGVGLVAGLHAGIVGFFIGYAFGELIGLGAGAPLLRGLIDRVGLKKVHFKRVVRFGLPLVPATAATFLLYQADRWFILAYMSSGDLGIYSVGARVAMIGQLVTQVVMIAFQPHSMRIIHHEDRNVADIILSQLFRYYGAFSVALIIGLGLVAPYIVRVVSAPDYFEAHTVIPVLVLSHILFGCTYFTSLGTWKTERTYLYSFGVVLGVLANLGLNAALIPRLGIDGAAVATMAGMFVLSASTYMFSQRQWRINFSIFRATAQFLISIGFLGWLTVSGYEGASIESGLAAGFVAIAAVIIVSFKWDEVQIGRQQLVHQLKAAGRRFSARVF